MTDMGLVPENRFRPCPEGVLEVEALGEDIIVVVVVLKELCCTGALTPDNPIGLDDRAARPIPPAEYELYVDVEYDGVVTTPPEPPRLAGVWGCCTHPLPCLCPDSW